MKKIKVLIAEDNHISTRILTQIINEEPDFELTGVADNGLDAYRLVKEKDPDVLLLDIIMPEMNGVAVLDKLHKDRKKGDNRPYVIILSSVGNDRITAEVFKDGADYFLRKPYDRKLLVERIRSLVSGNWLEEQAEKRIGDILHEFGATSNLKGYQYLKEAAILCMQDDSRIHYITKTLYPEIAAKYDTTPDCVERAMRHTIKLVWEKNSGENRQIFGQPVTFQVSRPTNTEFIVMLIMICMRENNET